MAEMLPEPLTLPEPFLAILHQHDALVSDFDEAELGFVLEGKVQACGEISETQRKGIGAEIAAFRMSLRKGQEKCVWGTRFRPAIQATHEDGTPFFYSDIAHIDDAVIQYWSQRATESQHPVLRARYADVLWDLTKAATGGKPSIEMARQAIDAYIECGQQFPNTGTVERRLERALELALSVGDGTRAGCVVDTMLQLLDHTEYPGSRVLWLFDVLYDHRGVSLSQEQEKKLVDTLETELKRICESPDPVGIVAKEPALRLAKHYEKSGQPDQVKRVICTYGVALATFAENAQGLVAMHWLQEAYATYIQFGLKGEAEQFQIAAKNKGEEAKSQMVRYSHSVEIPNEEIEKVLEDISEGDLASSVTRIAVNFLPRLDELRKQLDEVKENAKLLSMIPVAKMGENQVIARIGSIDNDPEGRLMCQMADNVKWLASLLGLTIDRVRTKFDFTAETVVPIIFRSPLFDESRRPLFENAVNAYIREDHIAVTHILIPQIEQALRRLLGFLGKATNKHRRSDLKVMVEKSLSDILENEPIVHECLGDDMMMYLRVFLCDPRGFNIRNSLTHGLLEPKNFSRFISDRILHILFLLSHVNVSTAPTEQQ
jgi:hypothetical protein